jgi:hypothetical protein
MVRHCSLFGQLVALFSRGRFDRLVQKHGAERYTKGFRCWDQFVAMLFCQLAQAKSLREIAYGLQTCMGKLRHLGLKQAPAKSTLSYANANRPWELFQDLFYDTLELCRSQAPGKQRKFRFKNKLLSLYSSTISLCLSLFPWAKFRRTKGAVKLHMLLDHDGYLPSYAWITDGKCADVRMARLLNLAPGSIIVMDRGYNDYRLFSRWCSEGIWFVTRLKDNADYEVVENLVPSSSPNIMADQLIRLTGLKAQTHCPQILRRVVVWDEIKKREIVLLTNHLKFAARTIADIYKDRWQIEIFFKALKQNLKVKTFVGTSDNALRIQIWTALIAMLLIKFLLFKSRFKWSLSNLIAMTRWNLFTYRNLWDWIDQPFGVPPAEPAHLQLPLFLSFGTASR